MSEKPNYQSINRNSWNAVTDIHIASKMYDTESFLAGKSTLNEIELEALGEVSGKSILHLQCHFGQDTLSLARLGAKTTGIDLSDVAISRAKEFNKRLGLEAKFICCNIYDLPTHLDEKFDIVFTSYGVIGWLPDLLEWGKIISHFLKPGGTFVIAEFHQMIWMFDEMYTFIKYSYFNDGMLLETNSGTYAEKDAPITQQYAQWNHSLSEVFQGLMKNGLRIESFKEYDYSPYDCLKVAEKVGEKKYRIKGMGNKLPMVFCLKATK